MERGPAIDYGLGEIEGCTHELTVQQHRHQNAFSENGEVVA